MNSFIDIVKKADKNEERYCHICTGTDSPAAGAMQRCLIVFKIPVLRV